MRAKFTAIPADDIKAYSEGRLSSLELRRRYDVTFADILVAVSKANLPLPRAPVAGREQDIARARELLFPHD